MTIELSDKPVKLMSLRDCEEQRAALLERMQSMVDAAGDDTLSEEHDKQFQEWNTQLRRVEAQLGHHRMDQDSRRHAPSITTGFNPGPDSGFMSPGGMPARRPHDASTSIRATGGPKSYASLFGLSSLSTDGWNSFDDFLSTIHSGAFHPAIKQAAAGGVGSSGGFLVPEQFAARMLDTALEDEIVRPRADVWPMTGDTLKVAGVDASDSSTDLYGGISGSWLGEGDTISFEDVSYRKIELHSKKLAVLSKASNEVREDGIDFESQLETTLRKALSWHLDKAFLRGTGVGEPLGVLNDPALVTVDEEVGQVADTIIYENLVKMLARLHTSCFARSVWVCNPTCIPLLLQLTVPVGTSGSFIPVMSESDGVFKILSRPVLFSEKLPSVGDEGDIILADFSQYVIGLRREMTLDKSMHYAFPSDEVCYRGILRVDGQGKWSSAYTPANGDSQSWCVALAAR